MTLRQLFSKQTEDRLAAPTLEAAVQTADAPKEAAPCSRGHHVRTRCTAERATLMAATSAVQKRQAELRAQADAARQVATAGRDRQTAIRQRIAEAMADGEVDPALRAELAKLPGQIATAEAEAEDATAAAALLDPKARANDEAMASLGLELMKADILDALDAHERDSVDVEAVLASINEPVARWLVSGQKLQAAVEALGGRAAAEMPTPAFRFMTGFANVVGVEVRKLMPLLSQLPLFDGAGKPNTITSSAASMASRIDALLEQTTLAEYRARVRRESMQQGRGFGGFDAA